MNAFFKDIRIGDFVASEYGLIPASFDYSWDEESDIAMESESDEEYTGRNTIPLDYGSTHQSKPEFSVTFIKKACGVNEKNAFENHEVRSILRELTGKQYYRDLYFLDDKLHTDERIHYKVKVVRTEQRKIHGQTVALKFTFQCNSFWAYTDIQSREFTVKGGQTIHFYNSSDEVNDYLYPQIEFSPVTGGNLTLTNLSDQNRRTSISNNTADEIISLDSENEIISSSHPGRIILNDFNLKWPRFVPGMNQLLVSADCKMKITYQLLRKVVL